MKNIVAMLFSSTALKGFPVAFNNGDGWKVDENGNLAKDEKGNPIWVDGDGERSLEGGTVQRLNNEAKTLRQRAETAEAKAKEFDGLKANEAREAIELISKLDKKKLIDAGEVDKVREEISKQFNLQIAEKDAVIKQQDGKINTLHMDQAFEKSEFVRSNVAVPVSMFRAEFGHHFKMEDGRVVGIGADGNRIASKKKIGEYADFEESLQLIVENYPFKKTILKAPDASGSGSGGGGGNRNGMVRVVTRSEFEGLTPQQQSEAAARMAKGEINIE